MKHIFLCCATDAPASAVVIKALTKKVPVTGINSINYGLLRGETVTANTSALIA